MGSIRSVARSPVAWIGGMVFAIGVLLAGFGGAYASVAWPLMNIVFGLGWVALLLFYHHTIVRLIPDAPSTVPGRRRRWLRVPSVVLPVWIIVISVAEYSAIPPQLEIVIGILSVLGVMPLFGVFWMNAKALAEPIPEQDVPRGDPSRWFIGLAYFPFCIPQLNSRFRLAQQWRDSSASKA